MKTSKNIERKYLHDIKAELSCPRSVKKVFLKKIKQQMQNLQETSDKPLTRETIEAEIGTPQEIARGLESREDLERLKKKARRYTLIKWICIACLLLALLAVVITVVVIKSNDSYYTTVETHIDD